MAKKVVKKSSKSVARKSVVSAPPQRKQRHSLSDTTLMFLALFFSLAALFIVLVNKQQTETFQRFMRMQMNDSMRYVPAPGQRTMGSPTPSTQNQY